MPLFQRNDCGWGPCWKIGIFKVYECEQEIISDLLNFSLISQNKYCKHILESLLLHDFPKLQPAAILNCENMQISLFFHANFITADGSKVLCQFDLYYDLHTFIGL